MYWVTEGFDNFFFFSVELIFSHEHSTKVDEIHWYL